MKSHLKKLHDRPLSWSSLFSFAYNRDEWAKKYLLGIATPANKLMEFGKTVGELIATNPKFLPIVPRYEIFEKELKFKVGKIPLVGYIDSFSEDPLAMFEYKTYSKKDKWTQKVAQDHGQLLMYQAGLWLLYDTPPEKIGCELVAIQVEETGDFQMTLSKAPVQIFEVKHTKIEVLNFLVELQKTYKDMEKFALEYGE
mgnify:CR=1 FL=1